MQRVRLLHERQRKDEAAKASNGSRAGKRKGACSEHIAVGSKDKITGMERGGILQPGKEGKPER